MVNKPRSSASIAAQNLAVIIKQCLTNADNETASLIKILSMLTVLVGLGLSIFDVVKMGRPFDIQSFGIGMGALFGLVGAALGVSFNSEIDPNATATTTTSKVSSIIGAGQVTQQQTTVTQTSTQVTPADPTQQVVQPIVMVPDTVTVEQTVVTSSPMTDPDETVQEPVVFVKSETDKPKTPFPFFKKK